MIQNKDWKLGCDPKTAIWLDVFRLKPIEYISMIVNKDAEHACLADLGKLGVVQFTDPNRFIELSIFPRSLVRRFLKPLRLNLCSVRSNLRS